MTTSFWSDNSPYGCLKLGRVGEFNENGLCDDEVCGAGVEVRGDPEEEGFGITTTVVLPGDLEVMLYEPRHRTAI